MTLHPTFFLAPYEPTKADFHPFPRKASYGHTLAKTWQRQRIKEAREVAKTRFEKLKFPELETCKQSGRRRR
jgi:hypothetical protein